MSLIYLSCAWVAGILLGYILLGAEFNLPLVFLFTGLVPLPLLFLARQHRKLIILSSLCLLALFGSALRYQSSLPIVDQHSLQFYNDRGTVEIKGLVDRDPDVRDKTTHLHFSAQEIKVDGDWQQVSGAALLFVPRYPAHSYGDLLRVTGKLETPPQLDGFDYQDCVVTIASSVTGIMPVISTLWPSSHTWIFSISRAKRFVSKSSVVSF